MKIFISYPHEDRKLVEELDQQLRNRGFESLWDDRLTKGGDFIYELKDLIRQADLAILLLSPEFVEANSFCQTELRLIKEKWPKSAYNIVPVGVRKLAIESLPPYISSTSIMWPKGNLVADIITELGKSILTLDQISAHRDEIRDLDRWWESKKLDFEVAVGNLRMLPENSTAYTYLFGGLALSLFAGSAAGIGAESPVDGFFSAFSVGAGILGISFFIITKSKIEKYLEAEGKYKAKRMALLGQIQEISEQNKERGL